MTQPQKQITIPKEDAVFRMDKNGVWHNEHGRFEHPRIIKYFNASIRKDENGYHVYQVRDDCEEKVYFPYEDTALFVVDLIEADEFVLVLNNTEQVVLDPGQLFVREDSLYIETAEHRIKFNDRVLLKFSRHMTETDDGLFVTISGNSFKIREIVSTAGPV